MKKTVVLRGPTLTQSGYGVHCRQIARYLLSRDDIDVRFLLTPWGDTPWFINPDELGGFVGQVMQRSSPPTSKPDVSFQLQLPNEWDPTLAYKNVGMSAVVETDVCDPSWVNACNAMTMVIVPSTHAKSCLESSGKLTTPVVVVPEAYCDAIRSEALPTLPEFSTQFNFLVFGQLTGTNPNNDRKNIAATIKLICDEFKDDERVGIVIKTNAGRNTMIDKSIVTNMMKQLLNECRSGQFPRLHLLHGDMSDEHVAALYKHPQVKALVTLTRGEGFGLPILEAAASGLPIIATGWSGHTDFLRHGKYISVQYQLRQVHRSRVDNIFVKEARWANPSEDDAKRKLRKFFDSPETPRQWASELREKIVTMYDIKSIFALYDSALKDVL